MKLNHLFLISLLVVGFLGAKERRQPDVRKKGIGIASNEEIEQWKSSKRVALIIGVNDYKSLAPLAFANNDSLKMKLVLEQVGKFDEIILMNDETGSVKSGLLPTKKNILKAFKRILKDKPDLFLFYFSGHGFMAKNGENVLAPLNAIYNRKGFRNTINISYLARQAKKISKSIFFIDACRENIMEGRKGIAGKLFGEFPDEVINARGIAMMMSTKPGGYSYEIKELGGGLFTYYLVKGISGEVQDLGPEYVTFESLRTYVERSIRKYIQKMNGKEQIPYTAGDYTGNFLIAVGRPEKGIYSKVVKYLNESSVLRFSRILYDTYERRLRQNFFIYGTGRKYLPSDLNGVSRMSYEYGDNRFISRQYNTKGDLVFNFGAWPLKKDSFEIRILKNNKYIEHVYTKNLVRIKEQVVGKSKKKILYKNLHKKRMNHKIVRLQTFKDDSGKIIKNNEGISIIKTIYGRKNNLLSKEFFDSNHNAVENSAGIAKYLYQYNKNGQKTLEQYSDARGKPAENKLGISMYSYIYDDKGNKLEESFFNSDGQPFEKYGVAKIKYKYNKRNQITEVNYLDVNQELKENGTGIAQIKYIYGRNKKKIEYRDQNLDLITYGIAQKYIEYDRHGNVLEQEYRNSQDRLINEPYYQIARIVYRYNKKKQKIREIYYNDKNYQSSNVYGISEVDFIYNKKGLLIKKIYKNKWGEVINDIHNISYIKYFYNNDGHLEKEEYFDNNDQLRNNEFGIAKIQFEYNENFLVGKKFFDFKKNQVNDPNGIARYRYAYDRKGRKTLEERLTKKGILSYAEYFSYIKIPNTNRIIKLTLDNFYRPIQYEFISESK